jgi:hypothetical protein
MSVRMDIVFPTMTLMLQRMGERIYLSTTATLLAQAVHETGT